MEAKFDLDTLPYHYTSSEVHLSSVAGAGGGGLAEVSIMLKNAQLAIANALVLLTIIFLLLGQHPTPTKKK